MLLKNKNLQGHLFLPCISIVMPTAIKKTAECICTFYCCPLPPNDNNIALQLGRFPRFITSADNTLFIWCNHQDFSSIYGTNSCDTDQNTL
jgi:hypothetical protein